MVSPVKIRPLPGQSHGIRPPTNITPPVDLSAHILDDYGFGHGGASPVGRLLVSAFAPSSDRIVTKLLAAFDQGVHLATLSEGQVVRFSIEGALASKVDASVMSAFVVRPLPPEEDMGVDVDPDDLCRALCAAIDLSPVTEGGERPIKAWQLEPSKAMGLFTARSFHEFRFGVHAPNRRSAGERLGEIAAEFVDVLAAHEAPIAYLAFPIEWSSAAQGPMEVVSEIADQIWWLRIAIGLPHGFTEPLEVQLAARGIALKHTAALCLYNPTSEETEMGMRFDRVALPRTLVEGARFPERPVEIVPGAPDGYVFAEGDARPGLVRDMIGRLPTGTTPVAGAMTVVRGHTLASWMVPAQVVDSFKNGLDDVLADAGGPNARAASLRGVRSQFDLTPLGGRFWVAWRGPDTVGVVRHVLDVVRDYAQQVSSQPDSDPNIQIDYLISRVVDGETCAGKLRLSATADIANALIENHGRLEDLLEQVVVAGPWEPLETAWQENPISVRREEPGESPWAELAIGQWGWQETSEG